MSRRGSPRRELLTRLLEAHERSRSYGRAAPWPRDVIVKLDARAFPDAFAPNGLERRASLVAAAASSPPKDARGSSATPAAR